MSQPGLPQPPSSPTMSNGSDQRIRQVAIVLQSLDAATSRGLLAQLPPVQCKLVRQAMVNLGPVSAQERAAAIESMQGLLHQSRPQSRSPSGKPKAQVAESPASELLAAVQASDGLDEVILSDAALANTTARPTANTNASSQNPPIHPRPSWHHLPNELLSEILQSERPMLIATVLNQLSVERATAIIQTLPIQIAGATLSAVPQVQLTDLAILKDIEAEIERKVSKFEPQRQLSEEGLARLEAIMAGMPSTQKDIWANAIHQSNPVLARKLGLVRGETDRTATDSVIAAVQAVEEEAIATEAIIPPVVQERTDVVQHPQDTLPIGSPLDCLSTLSDRDFVTVLHACSPQMVLLAISGASKPFVTRVERLIPPKDIQRLRKKLTELGATSLKEIDAAQQSIEDMANKLLAIGKIGALQNVTFTAAA